MEGQKQRHPSGGVSVSTEMVLGLEGVELGADGKVRTLIFFTPGPFHAGTNQFMQCFAIHYVRAVAFQSSGSFRPII